MPDVVDSKLKALAGELRRVANGRESLEVSQFQFIDLDEIRRAYGDAWPARRTRVLDSTRTFIRGRLGANDVVVSGSDGFLVVFGDIQGQAAKDAGKAIVDGLNAFYTGEPDRPAPKMGVKQLIAPTEGLVASLGLGDGDWSPLPETPIALSAKPLCWRYTPTWDVRREVVSRFYLTPFNDSAGQPIEGYNFENINVPKPVAAELDRQSLDLCSAAIAKFETGGGQAIVGVSAHVSTLINIDSRGMFLAKASELSSKLARFRILSITGMKPGFPRLYLPEIVGNLKPLFPNIILGAAWDEPDTRSMSATAVTGIAMYLPARVTHMYASTTVTEIVARVREAAKIVHHTNKALNVVGEFDAPLASKLVDAGADFLSSPRVWPRQDELTGVLRWPAVNLPPLAGAMCR